MIQPNPPRGFRLWRYLLLTPVLGAFGLSVLWALGLVSFIATILSLSPAPVTQKTDGIVVLTGGEERVRTGITLLAKGSAKELLISGVNKSTNLRQLLHAANLPESATPCCITLGFAAMDTVGNAHETAAWVQGHHITSLRLVTANYHMPRAWVEMRRTLPEVRMVLHPVSPTGFNLRTFRGWQHALIEYHKTLIALARLAKGAWQI